MSSKTIPSWNEFKNRLIADLHYSDATIQRTHYTYHIFIQKYCPAAEEDSLKCINHGINAVSDAYQNGIISKDKLLRLRRVAYRLILLVEQKRISWQRAPLYGKKFANRTNEELLLRFLISDKEIHANSINYRDEGIIRQFLLFIEDEAKKEINSVNVQDILGFLKYMKVRRPAGLQSTVSAMKHFFNFLVNQKIVMENLKVALRVWDTPHTKMYGIFSLDEKERILSVIDRTTDVGKRDFAIFSLAADCGLRSSDICSLKLKDINWRDASVSITQSKTAKLASIPFSKRTGDALSDYILHTRGETQLTYVFVKPSYCDTKMTSPLLCYRLKKYLTLAGIQRTSEEKISMHTFRRSLGTELIDSGSTLELVSQVLGHTDTSATRKYISFTGNSLLDCALDFSLLPVISEVHYD